MATIARNVHLLGLAYSVAFTVGIVLRMPFALSGMVAVLGLVIVHGFGFVCAVFAWWQSREVPTDVRRRIAFGLLAPLLSLVLFASAIGYAEYDRSQRRAQRLAEWQASSIWEQARQLDWNDVRHVHQLRKAVDPRHVLWLENLSVEERKRRSAAGDLGVTAFEPSWLPAPPRSYDVQDVEVDWDEGRGTIRIVSLRDEQTRDVPIVERDGNWYFAIPCRLAGGSTEGADEEDGAQDQQQDE